MRRRGNRSIYVILGRETTNFFMSLLLLVYHKKHPFCLCYSCFWSYPHYVDDVPDVVGVPCCFQWIWHLCVPACMVPLLVSLLCYYWCPCYVGVSCDTGNPTISGICACCLYLCCSWFAAFAGIPTFSGITAVAVILAVAGIRGDLLADVPVFGRSCFC